MSLALVEGSEPIPGYRLVRVLGQGGFGQVWEAEAPGEVQVALKFIRTDSGHAGNELRAIKSIRAIRHPHLLEMHFAVQQGAFLIIATSLCDKSLWDRYRECEQRGLSGIPVDELLRYMDETAIALDFLNESRRSIPGSEQTGIQHRDIKPHNIFLVGGSVKVADFGLAKALENTVASHTGAMTPHYAAPEMFDKKVAKSSDQYSLACTYCQLRTGVLPFMGTMAEIVKGHLANEPNLRPLPSEERPAVARALAKDPAARWENCRAFVAALQSALLGSPAAVTPPKGINDTAASAIKAPPLPKTGPPSDLPDWVGGKRKKRHERPPAPKSPADQAPPIPTAPTGDKPRPVPASNPGANAVFRIEVIPSEAAITVNGERAFVTGSGGNRTLNVQEPSEGSEVTIVAMLLGYKPTMRTIRPALGDNGVIQIRLRPLPAIYRVTIEPATARLATQGLQATITGAGSKRIVTVAAPDGRQQLTLTASLDGYEPETRRAAPNPGSDNAVQLRLEPKPALYTLELDPSDCQLQVEDGQATITGTGTERQIRINVAHDGRPMFLVATRDGYKSSRTQIKPRRGTTEALRIVLEPLSRLPPELLVAPFSSNEANAAQQAWADFLNLPAVAINPIGLKLVLIPPGEYSMGSAETPEATARFAREIGWQDAGPEHFEDEHPRRRVVISKPFYIGMHEVTVGQFRRFVADQKYRTDAERDGRGGWGWSDADGKFDGPDPKFTWMNCGFPQDDDHPVVNVTHNDAVEFCRWLGAKDGCRYRLPTESEWEYACRAGSAARYAFGDDPEGLVDVANVADAAASARWTNYPNFAYVRRSDGFVFTAPVGRFRPNNFGLYDMHGNVWEWCQDWYGESYYRTNSVNDPQGPDAGVFRVLRGGAWSFNPANCRAADRGRGWPDYRDGEGGFRVVREV